MENKLKQIISNSNDWQSLKEKVSALSKKEKGDVFELFTKYFLQSHPDYVATLKHVWLFSELTTKQKQELNIPSNDQGIDLVALTITGDYWAIQCKYLDDENQRLSHDYISTFGNLAFAISKKFSFGLVCTTAERFSKAYIGQQAIAFCTSEVWRNLTLEQFENIRKLAANRPVNLTPYKPFPHQQRAIKNAVEHFIKNKASRGKLILPCGSGKSLTGFWIAEKLKAKSIIVAVPSLALVRQTLNTWLREAVANKMNVEWICVCSDESIGKQDDVAVLVQDLGIPCVTDLKVISDWLKRKSNNTKVVFTTYQSGTVIADASVKAKIIFDLGIMDEAHKTVGQQGKLFSHLLYDNNIRISRRVFMTATERRYLGSSDEIASMDNPSLYGDTFELLTFKEALEVKPPILSDYRIITVVVDQRELKELIKRNAYVRPTKGIWNDEVEAHTLTSIIALRKAMQELPIKHAVSFHTSIARAKAFEESQIRITEAIPDFEPIESFHVSGAMPTAERSKTIHAFVQSPKALITNARCLTEGVDIPNIDCILFADPKRSTIDIVQAVGRALRVAKGKKYGYVIIPVLSDSKNDKQMIDDESYGDLLLTLRALASNDERIIEYFRLKSEKSLSKGKRSSSDKLIEIFAENIDLQKLVDDVELKVWSRLAKLSWRPFAEAREFVHSLSIKSEAHWRQYCKSERKPKDIPNTPSLVYKNKGWISNGDWFGTGSIASSQRSYWSFIEARKFVRSLNLKGQSEWNQYCKSGKMPKEIPTAPNKVYKDNGWISYGDWLGTGNISNRLKRFRSFDEARTYVRSLDLKGESEWREFSASRNKPDDIPAAPSSIYKNQGWKSWGDWLGSESVATRFNEYKPFVDARKFIHSLQLKNEREWRQYCKSKERPKDIPITPERVYKDKGWKSKGDWLGTGIIAPRLREYRPFTEAKEFVKSLSLKSATEWLAYCKSGKKPDDISSVPERTYKNDGWKGMGDWLGTGTVATFLIEYRPFIEARKFVHSLNLKSGSEWTKYCRSGKKPKDIPVAPRQVYKNKGWVSNGDWLGTGRIADQLKEYRPYNEARNFVQSLRLKNVDEWTQYCKSGKRPDDIPRAPQQVYKNKGWIGNGNWLGTGRISNQNKEYLTYAKAKKFVHSLKFKNQSAWKEYCKSKQRPSYISSNPNRTYKNKGWTNLGDWLGVKTIATRLKEYRSFNEARNFVHSLHLKSGSEWRQYCALGKKPHDIPTKAYRTYKTKGWVSMGDWLGTDTVATYLMEYRSFVEARRFIHSLQLKNGSEWRQYCLSGKKPKDIPAYPPNRYKNAGWINWSDWLGNSNSKKRDHK